MTEHGQWYKVTFTLSGNLHVGSGRWGFVLPCRPYVPGWTLWGALVVHLKKTGRWTGGYGEIGCAVNERCWLGHLFLETNQENRTYRYLPAVDRNQGGKTVFAWRDNDGNPVDTLSSPTFFRHGVVRSHEQNQDSLDRLFLTESVQARQDASYRLSGIFYHNGAGETPLFQVKDRLHIGGNRQVSGAEIACLTVQPLGDSDENEGEKNNLLRLQHLRCDPANSSLALTGELERIVLRRTCSANGEKTDGFGQHFVDWGIHLAPGWKEALEHQCKPTFDKNGEFRHGTVLRLE